MNQQKERQQKNPQKERQQTRRRQVKLAYIQNSRAPRNKQRSATRRQNANENNEPNALSPSRNNSQSIETIMLRIENALSVLNDEMSKFVTRQELQRTVDKLQLIISNNDRNLHNLIAEKDVYHLNQGIKNMDKNKSPSSISSQQSSNSDLWNSK